MPASIGTATADAGAARGEPVQSRSDSITAGRRAYVPLSLTPDGSAFSPSTASSQNIADMQCVDCMHLKSAHMRRSWYHGAVSREQCEMQLKGLSDGSFLVRDSSDAKSFTLVVKCNGILCLYALIDSSVAGKTSNIQITRKPNNMFKLGEFSVFDGALVRPA